MKVFSHGCRLATSHSTNIRPQQNMTTVTVTYFPSSITTDHCSDACAIRSHDFPCHHFVTTLFVACQTVQSVTFCNQVSRNVAKIGQTVSDSRSVYLWHARPELLYQKPAYCLPSKARGYDQIPNSQKTHCLSTTKITPINSVNGHDRNVISQHNTPFASHA